MQKEITKKIKEIGIIPVINIKDPAKGVPLAKALTAGGIPVIEITLRSSTALESIKNIRAAYPDLLLGAGTVLRTDQVDAAMEAGADFIVSPGLNPATVRHCQSKGIAIFPGAVTASEIELGISLGLSVFKFFPSDQAGGLDAINMFKGPFGGIEFIPTGGIHLGNLGKYMASPVIAAAGGSFVGGGSALEAGNWDLITAQAKEAVKISLGFSLAHVGINSDGGQDAAATARWFFDLFGLPVRECENSVFAGTAVECMKGNGRGTKGHIAVSTLSPTRAMAYLAKKGVEFHDPILAPDGKLIAAYLKEEIAGFAVHIVQK